MTLKKGEWSLCFHALYISNFLELILYNSKFQSYIFVCSNRQNLLEVHCFVISDVKEIGEKTTRREVEDSTSAQEVYR